ncbi:MAG: HAMP domain-containing protein [Chloroflexaceae bacterium]|nr:HAMP domain-containing protein [Chloroflexaceae bacterium]
MLKSFQRLHTLALNASIQTKIVLPLFILFILSILISTLGFLFSTSATQKQVISRQLEKDIIQVETALQDTYHLTLESGTRLAQVLEVSLLNDSVSEQNIASQVSKWLLTVRDDYHIDQIIVQDTAGRVYSNIAPSHLEAISVTRPDLIAQCTGVQHQITTYETTPVLIVCTPVFAQPDSTEPASKWGYVYSIVDLQELVARIRQNLDLVANPYIIRIGSDNLGYQVIPLPDSQIGSQVHTLPLQFGADTIDVAMVFNMNDINHIVQSGLQSMLLVNIGAALLSALVALFLTRLLVLGPLTRLTAVAQQVAEGDLSVRAEAESGDEVAN